MESRYSLLNCPLQLKLKKLCCSDPSNPSKWVYAVFWRILPRIYPPPKWDQGGTTLDRVKGNKRNWILAWEDGFCDFHECASAQSKGRFGPQLYFKMTHEVYSYGEGIVGKVAADNSNRWVFRPSKDEKDSECISSWSSSFDTLPKMQHPKTWKLQFNSGIQTIAVVSVREGVVQLGSFDKIKEDPNLAMDVQRKFSHLTTIQRPTYKSPSLQESFLPKWSSTANVNDQGTIPLADEHHHITGIKRPFDQKFIDIPKIFNMGWNNSQVANLSSPLLSMPPPMNTNTCNLGTFLSILPSHDEDALPSASNRNDFSRAIRPREHGYSKIDLELTWERHLNRGSSG